MVELLHILKVILLPIFIVMGIGYFLQKKFRLDLNTLAKLNIYFLVPGFIFVKLYSVHFSGKLFIYVIVLFFFYITIIFFLSNVILKLHIFCHNYSLTNS